MKKKRKKQQSENERFLFIHFTDDDILYYSPEFCESKDEALAKLDEDISYMAKKEGFKRNQVFRPNENDIIRRVCEKWE